MMKTAKSILSNWIPNNSDYVTREEALAAMKQYAKQACHEQRELCYANAEINENEEGCIIVESSILNAPQPQLL